MLGIEGQEVSVETLHHPIEPILRHPCRECKKSFGRLLESKHSTSNIMPLHEFCELERLIARGCTAINYVKLELSAVCQAT